MDFNLPYPAQNFVW